MEHVTGTYLTRPSLAMGEIVFKADRKSALPSVFFFYFLADGLIKDGTQWCKLCTQFVLRITTTGSEKSPVILITSLFPLQVNVTG